MARSWNTDLKLVAIEGDVEPGMTVPLDPDRSLHVGRSSKGMQLPDPLVSIHHADIGFELRRGFFVKDLDSATGTWVDEELIQGASRPIGIGTRLRFGDTIFEVQVRRRFPLWVSWVMAATVVFAACSGVAWLVANLRAPPPPLLTFDDKPIRQSSTYTSELLEVPPVFARENGVRVADLRIRRVTDYDYNGLDEVWLTNKTGGDFVLTFEPDGSWKSLGEIPSDCVDEAFNTEGFPPLDCRGETWMFVEGQYRLQRHDGVVVWVRPPRPETGEGEEGAGGATRTVGVEGPAVPMRVVLKEPPRLAGFLSERGINEPIHYLICEDAFPNVKAQVLTAMGQVKPLKFGCVTGVKLSEPSEGRPVAVALTANGRRALLNDVATFYGGNGEPVFVDEHRGLLTAAGASPGYQRGALKLLADGMQVFTEPVADERPLDTRHTLFPSDERSPPSELATVATITSKGVARLEPDGCATLEVRTKSFSCDGLCTGGSDFLTVREVGCGETRELFSVPYAGGTTDAEVDGLQVRAVVDSSSWSGRYRVHRARVAWRPKSR